MRMGSRVRPLKFKTFPIPLYAQRNIRAVVKIGLVLHICLKKTYFTVPDLPLGAVQYSVLAFHDSSGIPIIGMRKTIPITGL
jgi:hypothetical protein